MARTRRFNGPSLTPMIDVVFLLLLFFLLSAHFNKSKFMPINVAGAGKSHKESQIVLVELGGDNFLNGEAISKDKMIGYFRTNPPKNQIIAIRSDATITLEKLAELMDIMRASGWQDIVLVERRL